MHEKDLIIIDTETNGQDPQEPVQVAAIGEDFIFSVWMKPTKPCIPVAIAVHGKDDAALADFFTVEQIFKDYMGDYFLNKYNNYCYCGYNVDFDVKVISHACETYCGKPWVPVTLDVLQMARKLIPVSLVGSHSLDTVYQYLFPEKLDHLMLVRGIHSADVDCQMTKEVLYELWERVPEAPTLADLVKWTSAPMLLTEWPFGKHKGKAINDVLKHDMQYVSWFLYKCDFRASWKDLEFTLNTLLNKR